MAANEKRPPYLQVVIPPRVTEKLGPYLPGRRVSWHKTNDAPSASSDCLRVLCGLVHAATPTEHT